MTTADAIDTDKPDILAVLPDVDRTVRSILRRMPDHFPREDVLQDVRLVVLRALPGYVGSRDDIIRQCVARASGAVYDAMRRVHVGGRSRLNGRLALLRRTVDDLEGELGRTPTDVEISGACGLTVKQIEECRRDQPSLLVPLSTDVFGPASTGEPQLVIPDANTPNPAEALLNSDDEAAIAEAVLDLSRPHEFVIRRCFLESRSVESVAQELGATDKWVYRRKEEALNELLVVLCRNANPEVVRTAARRLPARYAQVIERLFADREPLSKVADGLGLSKETVLGIKRKALAKIRPYLNRS